KAPKEVLNKLLDESKEHGKEKGLEKFPDVEVIFLKLKDNGSLVEPIEKDKHGSLANPHTFAIPGDMFNNAFGWDSVFGIDGGMRAGDSALAKSMLDNMLFQIEHYGSVLNGPSSVFLDEFKNRSQPPLITGKI